MDMVKERHTSKAASRRIAITKYINSSVHSVNNTSGCGTTKRQATKARPVESPIAKPVLDSVGYDTAAMICWPNINQISKLSH